MKKIIGIAISVLMATLFCVTAFAVEPPLEKRNCHLSDYFRGVPVLFELYCCRSEGNKDGMHTRVV